jgi:tetratricopeptide (TPR) repeat protein
MDDTDRFEAAVKNYEQSYKLSVKLGNRDLQTSVLNNMAFLFGIFLGDYNSSCKMYQQALEIAVADNKRADEAFYAGNLWHLSYLGEFSRAKDYAKRAVTINASLGKKDELAYNFCSLGVIHLLEGNLHDSFDYFLQAISIGHEIDAQERIVDSRSGMAICYIKQRAYKEALEVLVDAEIVLANYNANINENTSNIFLIKGIIFALEGQAVMARHIFESELERTAKNLETKRWAIRYHRALAFAGITLLAAPDQQVDLAQKTYSAYQFAMAQTKLPGIIIEALLILRELLKADPNNVLAPVEALLVSAQ